MPRNFRRGLAGLLLLGGVFGMVLAQQQPGTALPNPRLTSLSPSGGKGGTTFEVTFTGTDLEEPEALVFSHPSIKAVPVIPPAPPAPAPAKPADPKKPAPAPMPPPKPPITKFTVTIGPDVPQGLHDVRIVNRWGISNPRAFCVGDLPEILEKEPNNDVTEANKLDLNSTVNGVIQAPTDVDYYTFTGKKGQRALVSVLSSSIDSRLNAAVELFDARGKRLGFNRRYNGTDALLDVVLPDDGSFFVRIFEFAHTQGSPEHFYRLTVSLGPWVDAVHPPCLEPGKTALVTVFGRNLPGGTPVPGVMVDGRPLESISASVTAPADASSLNYSGPISPLTAGLGGFEYRVKNPVGVSNPFLMTFAHAPVILEGEPNDSPEKAQKVTVPCEIAGRVDKKNDRDWYSFQARKGEVYILEILSDHLGVSADMSFSLVNPASKATVTEDDDNTDVLAPKFFTRSDDPKPYRFVVPADGEYHLRVSSQLAADVFGPRSFYRVRISPERPDFQLILMPADGARPDSGRLSAGGHENYTVLALRYDGFVGDITLTVEGLPKGVSCVPQVMAGNQRITSLVLDAAPDAPVSMGFLTVKGTATLKGQKVTRVARPASITWPVQPGQNIPTITRLNRNLALAVRDKAPFRLAANLDKSTLTQGDKANLVLKLGRLWPDFKKPLTAAVLDAIPNVQVNNGQPITLAPGKDDMSVPVAIAANAPPGTYNLVLRATAPVPFAKDPMAKTKPDVAAVLPSAPVTITILPKTVATIALTVPNPNLKPGTQGEVIVKLTRQYDYAGEFKLQLIVPPVVKGVAADEVVIPPGKDEAKLVVKVAPDAMPGARNDLVVRATALVNGTIPTVQEAKFNLNLVK